MNPVSQFSLLFCCILLSHSDVLSASISDLGTQEDSPQYLKSIGVQVGDNGCNCWMQISLCWRNGGMDDCCSTNYLDTSGNDFVGGTYQTFSSPEVLGECYLKQVFDHSDTTMTITHSGLDGVEIRYWNIRYIDGVEQYCKDGYWYDGSFRHEISCKDKGCPEGYYPEDGDIPGDGLIGEYRAYKDDCAKDCSARSDCKSFSYSYGSNILNFDDTCKLFGKYYPTADNYKDYQFCRKNESICSFVDNSTISGFQSYGLTKTKEECSFKAKDSDPSATGCTWKPESHECWLRYGNHISQAPGWTSCLFSGQFFWPLESADKICKEHKLTTNVKSQILCQEKCIADGSCIGIAYPEDNNYYDDCYICYDDELIVHDTPYSGHTGFKRRPN